MKFTIEQYNRFEKYFSNQMTEEERTAFYVELAGDPELQSEFEFEQQLRNNNSMETMDGASFFSGEPTPAEVAAFKASLQPNPTPVRSMNRRTLLAIAAGFIGLVLLGSVIYLFTRNSNNIEPVLAGKKEKNIPPINKGKDSLGNNKENNIAGNPNVAPGNKELYAQFYKKYDEQGNFPPTMETPVKYYKIGDINGAIENLTSSDGVLGVDENNGTKEKNTAAYYNFYLGLCYLDAKNTGKSIAFFNKALQYSKSAKTIEADIYWYLALAYVKNNEAAKATSFLERIPHDAAHKDLSAKAEKLTLLIAGIAP